MHETSSAYLSSTPHAYTPTRPFRFSSAHLLVEPRLWSLVSACFRSGTISQVTTNFLPVSSRSQPYSKLISLFQYPLNKLAAALSHYKLSTLHYTSKSSILSLASAVALQCSEPLVVLHLSRAETTVPICISGVSGHHFVFRLPLTWDRHCIGLRMPKCGCSCKKRLYKTGNRRNCKLAKLVKIVPYEREITHTNFDGDRTMFVKVMTKKLMHPSSRTRDWLTSVLTLTIELYYYYSDN